MSDFSKLMADLYPVYLARQVSDPTLSMNRFYQECQGVNRGISFSSSTMYKHFNRLARSHGDDVILVDQLPEPAAAPLSRPSVNKAASPSSGNGDALVAEVGGVRFTIGSMRAGELFLSLVGRMQQEG